MLDRHNRLLSGKYANLPEHPYHWLISGYLWLYHLMFFRKGPDITINHHLHKLRERDRWLPTEFRFRLFGTAHEKVYLCRAHELRVDDHIFFPVELPEPELIGKPQFDFSDIIGNLSRDKLKSPPRGLVVEEYS